MRVLLHEHCRNGSRTNFLQRYACQMDMQLTPER
jgi:hypothetical protein